MFMAGESSVVQMLTNQPGKIRTEGGAEIEVTFSFYRYQESEDGPSARKSSGGCCRVSDDSDVLREVFEAGAPVLLTSRHVEAEIRLDTPYSFRVVDQLTERWPAGHGDDAGLREGREDNNASPSYRRILRNSSRWEREENGTLEFVIREAFSGAALRRRFRPEK